MRSLTLLAAVAALAVPLWAGSAGAVSIKIVRGTDTEIVDTAKRGRGPVIVRGVGRPDKVTAPTAAAIEALKARPAQSSASGRQFWLYDAEKKSLVGCYLRGTARVDDDFEVRCTRAHAIEND